MQFYDKIQFGELTPTISTDDPFEFALAVSRFKAMNSRLKGQGVLRMRLAEKKKGKTTQQIEYPEFVRYLKKQDFDTNEEHKYTVVKMRVSKQNDDNVDIDSFPYFIPRTQCWYFHNSETEEDWFFDDLTDPKNPEWKKGTYDSDTFTWTPVEK